MVERIPTIIKQPNGLYALYSIRDESFVSLNMTEMEMVQLKASQGSSIRDTHSAYRYSLNYKKTKDGVDYSFDNLWEYYLSKDKDFSEEELREKFTQPYENEGDVFPFDTLNIYIYPYYDEAESKKFRLINTLTTKSMGFNTEDECYQVFFLMWSKYLSAHLIDAHFSKYKDSDVIDYAKFLTTMSKG